MRPFHWICASLGALGVAAWFAFVDPSAEPATRPSAGEETPSPADEAVAGTTEPDDPSAPDLFHPDRDAGPPPVPRKGGRIVVHVENQPFNLNGLLSNSGVTRRILDEIHASLIDFDVYASEHVPSLAEAWTVEDTLVLRDGTRVWGWIEELDDRWRVSAASGAPH